MNAPFNLFGAKRFIFTFPTSDRDCFFEEATPTKTTLFIERTVRGHTP